MELSTGTTDAPVETVITRKLEAAFVADCETVPGLAVMPTFHEELVVVAPRSHPKIPRVRNVDADTIVSFPFGCVFKRQLQSWLAAGVDVVRQGIWD